MTSYDYLVIGHVSRDRIPPEIGAEGPTWRAGGTAAYAGRTARALGGRVAVLTSAGPDFDLAQALPGLTVTNVPAPTSTSFTNHYTPQGRIQTVHGFATPLTLEHLPSAWSEPSIVHLGPIAAETDPAFVERFPASLIGLTPQGWMRRWDETGRVWAQEWARAAVILPRADAVILSEEDLLFPEMLDQFRRWSRLLVLTDGARGCQVYVGDDERRIPAPDVTEVDATGAGDIFAAAFLTYLQRKGGDPWAAAVQANRVAAISVTAAGLDNKIARIESLDLAFQGGP